MSIRSSIMCACVVAGAVFPPAFADADIIVETAPPPIQVEPVPPARTGYIWAPGYQKWENGQFVWVPGHWVEAQVHSHWESDRWEKMDDTHWRFVAGHWAD